MWIQYPCSQACGQSQSVLCKGAWTNRFWKTSGEAQVCLGTPPQGRGREFLLPSSKESRSSLIRKLRVIISNRVRMDFLTVARVTISTAGTPAVITCLVYTEETESPKRDLRKHKMQNKPPKQLRNADTSPGLHFR